jgi:L-lactate utilization protein LutC
MLGVEAGNCQNRPSSRLNNGIRELRIENDMEQQKNKEKILQSIREHKVKVQNAVMDYSVQHSVSGLSSEELAEQFKQSLKTAGANFIEVGKDAKELNQTEQQVLHGHFGVAENGAIWLEDKDLPTRISPFIVEKLIVSLNIREIVPTMQEAYRRINLKEAGFGVFISGPSKTADIEQSLVYGAHGAKEMTVLLV